MRDRLETCPTKKVSSGKCVFALLKPGNWKTLTLAQSNDGFRSPVEEQERATTTPADTRLSL
jgi:hypothetical protein